MSGRTNENPCSGHNAGRYVLQSDNDYDGDSDSETGNNLDNHNGDEERPLLTPKTAPSPSSPTGEANVGAALFLIDISRGHFWVIFIQVLSSQFISSFDSTIMASSHPVITSYFGAANSASWLSTAFMLTSTAFQPLLGRLSDAIGRKSLYTGCMAIFALATTLCATAWSIESFIFARALCGLGAGGMSSLGSIIISDLVPIQRRSAYQAYINVTYGVSSTLGAALGGTLAEALGWRWEFGVQVPPLLLCLVVASKAIPADLGIADEPVKVWQALQKFDVRGSLLLTTSVSSLILGLNLGGNIFPWSHPIVITALTTFTICFPIFLHVESRAESPIMPLTLLFNAPRANIIFCGFIGTMLSSSNFFNVPIYFQAVLLTSATSSGMRLALPSAISCIAGLTTGLGINWTRRLKWPLICGAFCWLAGSVCLWSLQRSLPSILFYLVLIPSALGQGFQVPGTFMATLACSKQSEQAVVISTLILWRSLGMVLGVALSSLVVQNALLHYLQLYVTGDDKEAIIARVRSSVEAVASLHQPYQEQAIQSYEAALRLMFACSIVLSAISALLLIPISIPRLAKKKI
ncbi:hypothetical protein G3M48_008452 [Beauveria asiatica]|uniref:Major facilitator superfamily (MFS) profile domain-containing protein n=1 Tax=Beauveria asiatica TaxID=1069075 RepID=A0AAW0RL85_9HYPO